MTLPSRTHTQLFLLLFMAFATVVQAAAIKFDIPAQTAPAALQLFIKQSGTAVMFSHDELAAIRANAVVGEFEIDAALERLLTGTGFGARRNAGNKFVVASERQIATSGSIDGSVLEEKSGRPIAGAKVTIEDSGTQTVTDRRGRFSFPVVEAGAYELGIVADGMQNTKVTDVTVRAGHRLTLGAISIPVRQEGPFQLEDFVVSAKKNDGILTLDPYSVEGRKEKPFVTGNMDIPRTIDDVQPYYVFDAKTIDRSGAANIEDFLKQQLTMNTSALSNGQVSGSAATLGNTSSINLRGLDADKTLILVNGRRMAGVNLETSDYQADLNGIPVSAVERIEVLPSSASGIYGGSAIGGVVNVILKRDYQGGQIRVSYDNTWDTDSPRRSVSANYGMSLEGGRTHIMLSASWADATPLLLQERSDIFSSTVARIQGNSPTFFYSNTNPWLGALPNITPSSSSQLTLTLKNGTVINSRNTYVPAGASPNTPIADLMAGLAANAGKWNMEFPASTQVNTGLLRPLGSTPRVRSIMGTVRRQMTPFLEAFADFSYNENSTMSVSSPYSSYFTVPATAPSNPFTTNVRVRFPDALTVPLTTESLTRSATLGLNAKLPGDWTGEADYTFSENRYSYQNFSVDSTARTADLATGALNPFVDSLQYPLSLKKYLLPTNYSGASRLSSYAIRAAGSLSALPWGKLNLTVGLERRIAEVPERTRRVDFPISTIESYYYKFYNRKSVTDSAYAEAFIPLVSENRFWGIHSFGVQVSGRIERFEVDTGTPNELTYFNRTPPTTSYASPTLNGLPYFSRASYESRNYTFGFKYQPVKAVTIRISQATAFLPPTPDQLMTDPEKSTITVNDPKTGQNGVPVDTLTGGNPALLPQSSKSLNAGVVWQPLSGIMKGLRVNAEYYKIEQFNYISSLGAQAIVNSEAIYPQRVTRNASGTIELVDYRAMNLYYRETAGWDLRVDYVIDSKVGRFTLSGTESIITGLKNQYSRNLPEYDAAGYSPGEGGAPKYKGVISTAWEKNGWSAGWTWRYIDSYKVFGAAGGPYSKQYANGGVYLAESYITPQGGDTVSSQNYHDAFVGYKFRGGENGKKIKILDGVAVQVGMRNVFNKTPPLDLYFGSNYYLSPYGDMRLRSYWVNVTKSF